MAREIERKLYQSLLESKFLFIKKGERHIEEVYRAVEDKYQHLCDNSYSCSENCSSGNNQPEWKHTVRNALQSLKFKNNKIGFTGKRGYWFF